MRERTANPHIIAAWLTIRLKLFCKWVVKKHLKYSDYWLRYEWQARGSGHLFGLLTRTGLQRWGRQELRQKLAEYWATKVTAVNSHVNRPADPKHPSLPFTAVRNTSDQCAACLNRFQYYCNCPRPVSQKKRGRSAVASGTLALVVRRLLSRKISITRHGGLALPETPFFESVLSSVHNRLDGKYRYTTRDNPNWACQICR